MPSNAVYLGYSVVFEAEMFVRTYRCCIGWLLTKQLKEITGSYKKFFCPARNLDLHEPANGRA